MFDNRKIGVFDSGLGGLTVLHAIHDLLPQESTLYLGDTAHLPYGTKSPETIIRYALNCARALEKEAPLKLLVVACGTATSVALETLQQTLSIPVVGVIEPAVQTAFKHAPTSPIGILATNATIASKAHQRLLESLGHKAPIINQACPLFVPLVEEGIIEGPIAEHAAARYLSALPDNCRTVILGCTHYPLLKPLLNRMRPHTHWVESGEQVARSIEKLLTTHNAMADQSHQASRDYLVTEAPQRFEQLFEYFLGKPLKSQQVKLVDVG